MSLLDRLSPAEIQRAQKIRFVVLKTLAMFTHHGLTDREIDIVAHAAAFALEEAAIERDPGEAVQEFIIAEVINDRK